MAESDDVAPTVTIPLMFQSPDPEMVVYQLHLYIGAAFALAILLRLPRVVGRFLKTREWQNGHFFWFTRQRVRPTITRFHPLSDRKSFHDDFAIEKADSGSAGSHTFHTFYVNHADRGGAPLKRSYPLHIASCPSILWSLSEWLNKPIILSYSNIQVLAMLAYLSLILYALFYHVTNPFIHSNYASWIAVSQLPFLIAFSSRNNILAWLLGLCSQHLHYLHRFLGRLIICLVNIHVIGYFYKWSWSDGIPKHLNKPGNLFGLTAWTSVNILFLFSSSFIRTRAYNLFRFSHMICYTVAIPTIYMHHPPTLPFILTFVSIYAFDRVLRLVKTRLVNATIRPIPCLDATRIEIPMLNSGWRPGQYVRIRVLSSSLGWFSWAGSHPFTIASAPITSKEREVQVGDNGIVLICKRKGSWTTQLFQTAKRKRYHIGGLEIGRTVKVLVEGPYGGPGYAMYSSYSAVVMFAGGSGITYALSVIQHLVRSDMQARSRVRTITLVWMVQKPDALNPLLPLLTALIKSCPAISVFVHYTRACITRPPRPERGERDLQASSPDESGLSFRTIPSDLPIRVQIGRPTRADFAEVLEGVITAASGIENIALAKNHHTNSKDERSGMMVGICGPAGMAEDVRGAVRSIQQWRKCHIGGVEIHEESFGW